MIVRLWTSNGLVCFVEDLGYFPAARGCVVLPSKHHRKVIEAIKRGEIPTEREIDYASFAPSGVKGDMCVGFDETYVSKVETGWNTFVPDEVVRSMAERTEKLAFAIGEFIRSEEVDEYNRMNRTSSGGCKRESSWFEGTLRALSFLR